MTYRVYQDGKRCSDYNIKGWNVDTFNTKREAEVFAILWAYPVTRRFAFKNSPSMEIGVEYNYSNCEFPVMMKIEEV